MWSFSNKSINILIDLCFMIFIIAVYTLLITLCLTGIIYCIDLITSLNLFK